MLTPPPRRGMNIMSRMSDAHAARARFRTDCGRSRRARTSGEGALERGDVFHVAVKIEAPVAALASNTGIAAATKRRTQLADEEAVHPYCARDDVARETHRMLFVLAEDDRREPVVGTIGELHQLVLVAPGLPGEDGTEHFLLDDFHVLRRAVHQGWFEVEFAGFIAMPAP